MHFLRSLFWVIIAVAMLIFAVQNNGLVTVNLWGGLQADVKLWLLVLGPLLIGFLPTWIFGRISLWQQRRQARVANERAQALPTYEMQTPATIVPGGVVKGGVVPGDIVTSHPAGVSDAS